MDPESTSFVAAARRHATFSDAAVIRGVNLGRRGRQNRGLGLVVAWASLWGLAGCFSPELAGAECMPCPDSVCPGTLVCQEQRCVYPNAPNACSAAGGGSGAEAGAGGTGNVGQGGSAPETGGSATSGEAGAGGAPSSLPTLEVHPNSLCTDDVSVSLSVKDGRPPYSFSIDGDASGLSLMREGNDAILQGTAAVGDYTILVRVTDADDRVAERSVRFHVTETPVVQTTTLPSACPDEKYDAKLVAEGGNGVDYVFTADIDPATGLSLDGDRLTGRFLNETGERGEVPLHVSVESGGCSSALVTLELEQKAASADVCPHIRVIGDSDSLPSPCAGNPYLASVSVYGGTPDYTWEATHLPQGLMFDAESRELSGSPEASGELTVEVTDGEGRTIQRDLELDAPRNKCWLGFLAPKSGATRLNLFDPLLGNRESFPDAAADPVLDFKFSPDGRFVAYRTGTDPTNAELSLVEIASFRQQTFDFESVSAYAWSSDTLALAVGFTNGDAAFLGGVDTSGNGGSGTMAAYPELTQLAVPAPLSSDPVWFAGSYLAFLSAPYGYLEPMWASRTSAAFENLMVPGEAFYPEGTYLRAALDGFFVIPEKGHLISYYGTDGAQGVPHDLVLIAPNGRFAGGQAEGALKIFKPATASGALPPAAPDATAAGCDAVLAWANDGKRLVCTRSKASGDQADLVTFDVDEDTGAIDAPHTVQGTYDFPAPALGQTGLARLFSSRDGRFAFATDEALYVTPTAPGATSVDLSVATSPTGSDITLAFSPDERFLLEHRGTKLRLFDFRKPPVTWLDIIAEGEDPPSAHACSEDLRAPALASPALRPSYCGTFDEHQSFAWSEDSRLVAIATNSGALLVKDLRVDGRIATAIATAECGTNCAAGDRFAFQP
jgi:hypothetical protein